MQSSEQLSWNMQDARHAVATLAIFLAYRNVLLPSRTLFTHTRMSLQWKHQKLTPGAIQPQNVNLFKHINIPNSSLVHSSAQLRKLSVTKMSVTKIIPSFSFFIKSHNWVVSISFSYESDSLASIQWHNPVVSIFFTYDKESGASIQWHCCKPLSEKIYHSFFFNALLQAT